MLQILFHYDVENIFLFGSIEVLDSKRILDTLKIGITLVMKCTNETAFTTTTTLFTSYLD